MVLKMKIELRITNNCFHLEKWRYSSFIHRSYYRTKSLFFTYSQSHEQIKRNYHSAEQSGHRCRGK